MYDMLYLGLWIENSVHQARSQGGPGVPGPPEKILATALFTMYTTIKHPKGEVVIWWSQHVK